MLMEPPFAVGVLVQVGQPEAGLQLSPHLFFQGVGELNAVVSLHALPEQVGIPEGIEGQAIGQGGYIDDED